ncbi:MAG: hypothetical protein M3O50_12880 [Myxococcota bacterium]|nr:hypothetical protein [Myxococcota bacterium]
MVADDPRPPVPIRVAIRVTRPFDTEDDLLANEPETLSRTSITLLGAPSRPQGVVLRFELVLASGQVLVRGEGRVVGYRSSNEEGVGALTLRFSRLDTRSKVFVDKAALLRDRRRSGSPIAMLESGITSPPAPFPPSASFAPQASASSQGSFAPPGFDVSPLSGPPDSAALSEPPACSAPAPSGRDALLERLRVRAQRLDPRTVENILEARRKA